MLTREQRKAKKEYKKNRKIRKWRRRSRCRVLKNILIWFTGFITSLGILAGSLYVGIGVIPLNNFVGNDESIVTNKIASQSVLGALKNIKGYTVSDFPVLEDAIFSAIDGLGLDGLVSLDVDKISKLAVGDITSGNGIDTIMDAIIVEATLEDVLDIANVDLYEIGKLSVFNEYEEVLEKPTSSEIASPDFNDSIYFYKVENSSPAVYKRAFKNNAFVEGVNQDTTLYYPALKDVNVLDLLGIIDNALDRIKVVDIVNTFIDTNDDSALTMINNIFKDVTIGGIGDISTNDIFLADLLPPEDNGTIFDILVDITRPEDGEPLKPEEITLGHIELKEEILNKLHLNLVLEDPDGEIFSILENITEKPAEDITIGILIETLKNPMSIPLDTIVAEYVTDEDGNIVYEKDEHNNDVPKKAILWKIIESLVPEENRVDGEITINSLMSITMDSIDNLKLSFFLKNTDSEIFKILSDVTGVPAKDITIGDFTSSSFDIGKLSLENVLDKYVTDTEGNIVYETDDLGNYILEHGEKIPVQTEMWKLVDGIVPAEKRVDGKITINSLSSLSEDDINGIKLSLFLETPTAENGNRNKALYDILVDVATPAGSEPINPEEITLNHLNLDDDAINKIHLSTVITDTSNDIYRILKDLTGKEANEITLADLNSSSFDIYELSLETVLERYELNEDGSFKLDGGGNKIPKNEEIWKILDKAIPSTELDADGIIRLKNLSDFNVNNVPLETVLEKPTAENGYKNQKLWDILKASIGDNPTIESLSSFTVDNVPLETVLEKPTAENSNKNKNIWDILDNAIPSTKLDADGVIKIKNLGDFDVNNVPLETVLEKPTAENSNKNKNIWDIIEKAIPSTKLDVDGVIKIKNLGDFDVNNVPLETVLPKTKIVDSVSVATNEDMWEILSAVIEKDVITIADLGDFDVNKLPLSAVMENNGSMLWQILDQAIPNPADSTKGITIFDLQNNFDVTKVLLSTVLEKPSSENGNKNEALWKILTEAVGDDPTISELSAFKIDNVKLETVLDKYEKNEDGSYKLDAYGEKIVKPLWKIISEAVGPNPTINELGAFNVKNVHLSTVIDKNTVNDNAVLTALLEDEGTTLGNIGNKLNQLKLKEMYGINCFTTDESKAHDSSVKYKKAKQPEMINGELVLHDYYVKVDYLEAHPEEFATFEFNGSAYTYEFSDEVYYISSADSGVWLLLLYQASNKDEKGNAYTYTCKCLTLGSLTSIIGDAADCFMNATIKMLVDSGILEETSNEYELIYNKSVKDAFNIAADPLGSIPETP